MKKIYMIEVDCANCANKMQEATKKVEGIKDCSINFMTQKLMVEFEENIDVNMVMKEVKKTCKNVDDDCEIIL